MLRHESFGFVAAVDTAGGGRVALFDSQGRPLRSLLLPGSVRGVTFSSDAGALLVFTQTGPHEHVVTRVALEAADAGTTLYAGPHRPLADVPSRRGFLLVHADGDSAPPSEPRRLEFVPYDVLARDPAAGDPDEPATRLVSAEAFLDPLPAVASAGRYLYYLRARGGPSGLRGELRPRALYRYDFLAGREEPLEIAK